MTWQDQEALEAELAQLRAQREHMDRVIRDAEDIYDALWPGQNPYEQEPAVEAITKLRARVRDLEAELGDARRAAQAENTLRLEAAARVAELERECNETCALHGGGPRCACGLPSAQQSGACDRCWKLSMAEASIERMRARVAELESANAVLEAHVKALEANEAMWMKAADARDIAQAKLAAVVEVERKLRERAERNLESGSNVRADALECAADLLEAAMAHTAAVKAEKEGRDG